MNSKAKNRQQSAQPREDLLEEYDDELEKSKTQIKKEMLELQELGQKLLDYNAGQLATFPLSESLINAIADYKKIKSNSAEKRQRQYIGKLMRSEDIEAIQARTNEITNQQHREARQQHLVENWRDTLLSDDDTALQRFIGEYPHCDRQQLRQLITNAAREKKQNKPPASARKLFKLIRETLSANPND